MKTLTKRIQQSKMHARFRCMDCHKMFGGKGKPYWQHRNWTGYEYCEECATSGKYKPVCRHQ